VEDGDANTDFDAVEVCEAEIMGVLVGEKDL